MSHLIVISSDAMVGEDLEYFKTTRSYQMIFKGGAEITNVSSIYPSITLPAHATMITGMYPEHHGIFSNMLLQPNSDPVPWQMDYSLLQCSDIFRAAKAAGKTTAAVFWPVTMNNPAIDYHIADYWREQPSETLTQLFGRTGSSGPVLEIIQKHLHLLAEEENYPIIYHCKIGTDRTGLITYLIMGLCDVSMVDLYTDYAFSNLGQIEGKRDPKRLDKMVNDNFADFMGDTPQETARNYLTSIGITEEELDRIVSILVEQ